MKYLSMIIILLVASAVMAGEISDYKTFWLGEHIYDGQTFSRNLTVTVPGTGDAFEVSCWWGSSTFTVWCPDTDNRFYLREDGNFEWEYILREPGSDRWAFKVDADSIRFLYQPPEAGRPDSVVASYAVYTTIGWGNIYYKDSDYREIFKCGKAFHIYRPFAVDASGEKIFGNQRIENGRWEIWFDSTWMANAEYPVVIGPTFGGTTDGASVRTMTSQYVYGSLVPSSEITSSGELDSISARLNFDSASVGAGDVGQFEMGYYNSDMDTRLGTTGEFDHCTNHGYYWTPHASDCENPADGGGVAISGTITSGTSYLLVVAADQNSASRYDTDAGYQSIQEFSDNYPLPASPADWNDDGNTRRFSLHAVYTESGGDGGGSARRRILIGK